jgi:glycosyltransferase involved in cell wall biosynthesis
MKISVALTSYNGACYIREQLQSIAVQTRQPDEVILCDDASTDGTAGIIRQFIKENACRGWTLTVNPQNIGFIANFRQALALCTGDVIFLSDQDDRWYPEKIERMALFFEQNEKVRALATSYGTIDAEGLPLKNVLPLYSRAKWWREGSLHRIRGSVFYSNVAQGCACAFRKEVAEEYLRKGRNCRLPHDWALNLLAFVRGGLYYWKELLQDYRVHGENTIGALHAEDTIEKRAEILRRFEKDVHESRKLLSGAERNRTERYAAFIRHRIELTEKGGFGRFLKGLCLYARFLIENSFYSYCKDYAVSRKKGMPRE